MKKILLTATVLAALVIGGTGGAQAQFQVNITVDENGNGTYSDTTGIAAALPFALQSDPGPGGLTGVLTYSLLSPPGLTAGDVLIDEPGGLLGDLIRFTPTSGEPGFVESPGGLIPVVYTFISDPVPEPASLAIFGAGLVLLAGFLRRRTWSRSALGSLKRKSRVLVSAFHVMVPPNNAAKAIRGRFEEKEKPRR